MSKCQRVEEFVPVFPADTYEPFQFIKATEHLDAKLLQLFCAQTKVVGCFRQSLNCFARKTS